MALLQEIRVPLLSVNDTVLTIISISFESGQEVRAGEVVMVFETSKTTYDVPAEADGFVEYECEEGGEYAINKVVARIFSSVDDITKRPMPGGDNVIATKEVAIPSSVKWHGEAVFSKSARKLMETHKVDFSLFSGMDFVSRLDVEEKLGLAVRNAFVSTKIAQTAAVKTLSPQIDEHGDVRAVAISKNKAREIEYLSDVQFAGLTSTINMQLDTEGIFESVNPTFRYLRNSLLPLVIYEASRLLLKFPLLNAYYLDSRIVYHKNVVPGFAIDVDKGLKVVGIQNAIEKELADIEQSIFSLSEKYLDDKLEIGDLANVTFTITDLTAEGVYSFVPLVNRMNSAILGISSVDSKSGYCILSLTFDHRVTEGRNASIFLQELVRRLESYAILKESVRISNVSCYKCMKTLKEDIGKAGFVRCITPQGRDAYICQSCLNGF